MCVINSVLGLGTLNLWGQGEQGFDFAREGGVFLSRNLCLGVEYFNPMRDVNEFK